MCTLWIGIYIDRYLYTFIIQFSLLYLGYTPIVLFSLLPLGNKMASQRLRLIYLISYSNDFLLATSGVQF